MMDAQRHHRRTAGAISLLFALTLFGGCGETSSPDAPAAREAGAGKGTAQPQAGPVPAKAVEGTDNAPVAETGAAAAAKPAPAVRPTREQAMAEMKKVGGRFFFNETLPGKPLDRVRLQDARIRDEALVYLEFIPDVPNLEIVYYNNVTDAGLVHLKALKNLKRLELEGTKVTDAGIAHIQNLTKLEYVNLSNTGVTGKGLEHLKGLTELQRLRLGFTDVSDDGLQFLTGLKRLRSVELDDTRVTEAGVSMLRQALPKCDVLWTAPGVAAVKSATTPPDVSPAPEARPSQPGAVSGDWPQWRGPNRDGVSLETGLLQEWPQDGPPLKWEARGIGWGYSTVVIQDGKLFTTGRRDKTTHLLARKVEDGTELWQAALASGEEDPFATPTADGQFVYALSREGELLCAESANGKEVWRRNFFKDFAGRYMSYKRGGGYSESPLIDGDLLICTPGGAEAFVVALNKKTGEVVWKVPMPANFGPQGDDAAGFSSPVISMACGIRQYVQMTGRGLISVAAADGKVLWTHNSIANNYNNIPTPIIAGDYVFASTAHAGDPHSGTALVKLLPDNGGIKVEEVYRLPERAAANHHGGMIRIGNYIYFGHGYNRGFPVCLEMSTGKIMWKPGRGPGGGGGSASIVCADGHLYFHYENGVVALIEAKPNAYKVKSTFKMPFGDRWEWTHPVVAGGCLYLRGENWLRCYDVRQPKPSVAVESAGKSVASKSQPADVSPFAEPLTLEQAVAELKKVHGQVLADKQSPDKPMTWVWLQNPAINDANLAAVKYLPALNRVDLVAVNSVTDAGLVHLAGITNLNQLNLEGSRIGDRGLEHLKGLTNLRDLCLIDTQVTSAGLVHLKDMKSLKKLKLSFTDVDDSGMQHLVGLTQLVEVALDDTRVTEQGAELLRQALPKCRVLTSANQVAIVGAPDSPANDTPAPSASANSTPPGSTKGNPATDGSTTGDSPQWRGANRDGISHEVGLLQEWPEEGPPLRWEAKGIEWGYSSPVVQAGTIYTTGYSSKLKHMSVSALKTDDGKLLWREKIPVEGKNGVLSTPTLDGQRLYALSREGEMVCLETGKGSTLWSRNFATEFGGTYQSAGIGGGFSESVLIDGNLVICTPGGPDAMMAALDKSTGQTVWQAKCPPDVGSQGIDAAGFSSPVVSTACGIRQYVQQTGRGLMSVSPDGKVLWTYNRIANKFGNIPTPIVQGDFVFASTAHANDGMSGSALLKIVPSGSGLKAEEVYRAAERIVANHHGGMVLVGECIFMGHGYNRGFPLCLEMKTGKIKWRPGRGPGSGTASVIYADGHIYFRYEDGTVALVEANPDAYVLKSKFRPPPDTDAEWTHPVIAGGCLYLRGQNRLLCYDVRKH